MKQKFTNRKSGFTVVEITVVVTILALLTPVVIFGLGGFYQDFMNSIAKAVNDDDTRFASDRIASDLVAPTGFRAAFSLPAASAPNNGTWFYCGKSSTSIGCDNVLTNDYTKNRVLIAYTNAIDFPTRTSSYMPAFLNLGSGFNLASSTPATNAYIYFVAPDNNNPSKNNLYRRTIINIDANNDIDWSQLLFSCSISNPSGTGCITPSDTKNSCASTVVSSYPSVCGSSDAILLYGIESFWVDYYDSNNVPIANAYVADAVTAAGVATRIKNYTKTIKITITKKTSNQFDRSSTSLSIKIP